jgi:hypothetical protein
MDLLQNKGAETVYCDPHIPNFPRKPDYWFDLDSIELNADSIGSYDCIVIATEHDAFDCELLKLLGMVTVVVVVFDQLTLATGQLMPGDHLTPLQIDNVQQARVSQHKYHKVHHSLFTLDQNVTQLAGINLTPYAGHNVHNEPVVTEFSRLRPLPSGR